MRHVRNILLHWKAYSPLQVQKLVQRKEYMKTLQGLSNQMGALQHKTLELERNTSLDWRMQTIEDDLTKLQVKFQGGTQVGGQGH